MIAPWAKPAWELNRDFRAFETMKTTAKTLIARFNTSVGALRSWDTCNTKAYSFQDPSKDFLMIIVSDCVQMWFSKFFTSLMKRRTT